MRKLKTTSNTKTEKPLVYFTKTENQVLKNEKSANCNENENRNTEVFGHDNRKTDLKTGQNRKTENPNCPPPKDPMYRAIWLLFTRVFIGSTLCFNFSQKGLKT